MKYKSVENVTLLGDSGFKAYFVGRNNKDYLECGLGFYVESAKAGKFQSIFFLFIQILVFHSKIRLMIWQ
jgi:hypothetical protein